MLLFEQATTTVTSSVANGFQFVSRMSCLPGLSSKLAPIALTDGLRGGGTASGGCHCSDR